MSDKSDFDQKVEDAVFLRDEFGIVERKGARLVSDDDAQAQQVTEAAIASEPPDPLENVPIPEADTDLAPDNDERMLKPVLHQKNDYSGAG